MVDKTKAHLWDGLVVLVTGVCGTVGSELIRQLSTMNCARIIGIDNNETELFFLDQSYGSHDNVELLLGDLRDSEALTRLFRGVDVVLHAAALKHVVLCEQSPREAVATNISGIMNVIDAAEANCVKHLLFTSSDKAVNPTNVMGTTKLMGERLMTAAHAHCRGEQKTIVASTRFGNVLGSRGSVVPLFTRQIAQGGPITLTDAAMTRFIMTLEDAVSLVMDSVFMARGGEVFVTKMPVVRIADLAQAMIEILAPRHGYDPASIEIRTIGSKPGEKLFEELLSEEEIRRTLELQDFFAILPAFKSMYRCIDYKYDGILHQTVNRPYNSRLEPSMSLDDIRAYLSSHHILERG